MEASNRVMRQSTGAATAEAALKKGPRCQKGEKKKGGRTQKSIDSENLLPKLYDIGDGDENQTPSKLEFLVDQRNERKSFLPPVIGPTGPERRKKRRLEQELRRKEREEKDAGNRLVRKSDVHLLLKCSNCSWFSQRN